MNVKEVRQEAKKRFNGICRVCHECNGVVCAGEFPGIGGVGTGVQEKYLRRLAKPNIEFLGLVDDVTLARLYGGSQAVIFPQEEDFGIVPLEAMASGRPVVAYRGGGALETIIDRITGVFFDEQTVQSLKDAVDRASRMKFMPYVCRGQAERFDVPIFREKMKKILEEQK